VQLLKLENICLKKRVDMPQITCNYLDYDNYQVGTANSFPSMSLVTKTKTINLKTPYDNNMDDKILKELINNLLKKDYDKLGEIQKRMVKFDIYDTDELYHKQELSRKFISKLLMLSNYIAVEGRNGPATDIISDNHSSIIEHQFGFNNGGLNSFHYSGLGNKIIIFRKTLADQAHWCLFYSDNMYALEEIGNYSNQYHVIEIEGVKQVRLKKLSRIINEN
jgi:hypothetical protein